MGIVPPIRFAKNGKCEFCPVAGLLLLFLSGLVELDNVGRELPGRPARLAVVLMEDFPERPPPSPHVHHNDVANGEPARRGAGRGMRAGRHARGERQEEEEEEWNSARRHQHAHFGRRMEDFRI